MIREKLDKIHTSKNRKLDGQFARNTTFVFQASKFIFDTFF